MSHTARLSYELCSLKCDMAMKDYGYVPSADSFLQQIGPFSAEINISKTFSCNGDSKEGFPAKLISDGWAFERRGNLVLAGKVLHISYHYAGHDEPEVPR